MVFGPSRWRRAFAVISEAGFVYSLLVGISKIETWKTISDWIVARYVELTRILEIIGTIVEILSLPIEIFSLIFFSIMPFHVPEEMRIPILVGLLAASLTLTYAASKSVPTLLSAKLKGMDYVGTLLVYPLDAEYRAEIADGFSTSQAAAIFKILLVGQVFDYYRGLRNGLPDRYLRPRYNKAASEYYRISSLPLFGPTGDRALDSAPLRRSQRRFKITGGVFAVILFDAVLHNSISTGLLIVWNAFLVAVTCLFAVALVAIAILVISVANRGKRKHKKEPRTKSTKPGWFLRVAWRTFLSKIEEGSDPVILDPGNFEVGYLEDENGAKFLAVTHEKDMSYGSIAGTRFRRLPRRLEIISHGGMRFPLRVSVSRDAQRTLKGVAFRFRPEGGAVLDIQRVDIVKHARPSVLDGEMPLRAVQADSSSGTD